jgi:hypothetical protein
MIRGDDDRLQETRRGVHVKCPGPLNSGRGTGAHDGFRKCGVVL